MAVIATLQSQPAHFEKIRDNVSSKEIQGEQTLTLKRLNYLNNITTALHHDAAALKQVPEQNQYLISSPYTTPGHLLDLSTLTLLQRLLAQALANLQPTDAHYATTPYEQAFNWSTIISHLRHLHSSLPPSSTTPQCWHSQIFYIVVFRSRLPPTTDRTLLGAMDERSHAEANASGGLLKYWFGIPDAEGRNLATCVWRHQRDARPAGSGEGHRQAAKATRELYTEWKIERLALNIEDDGWGGVGGWAIEEWKD